MKIIAMMLALLGVASADPKPAMKGWELYSWFDMACSASPSMRSGPNEDSVCFALLPGTNRRKTVEEIKQAAIGIKALEAKIATLSRRDEVFWLVPDASFDRLDKRAATTNPRQRAAAALTKHGIKLRM